MSERLVLLLLINIKSLNLIMQVGYRTNTITLSFSLIPIL